MSHGLDAALHIHASVICITNERGGGGESGRGVIRRGNARPRAWNATATTRNKCVVNAYENVLLITI